MAKTKKKVEKKTPGAFATTTGGLKEESVIPGAKVETTVEHASPEDVWGDPKPKKKSAKPKPEPAPAPKKHPPMDLTLFCAKANCRKWECRLAARAEMERARTGKTEHTFLEWKAMLDRERNAKG